MLNLADNELVVHYGALPQPYFVGVNPTVLPDWTVATAVGPDPTFGNVADGRPYNPESVNFGIIESPLSITTGEKVTNVRRFAVQSAIGATIDEYRALVEFNVLFTRNKRILDAIKPGGPKTSSGRRWGSGKEPIYFSMCFFIANAYDDENVFQVMVWPKMRIAGAQYVYSPDKPMSIKVQCEAYSPFLNNCYQQDVVNEYQILADGTLCDEDGNPLNSPDSGNSDSYPPISDMQGNML